MPTDLTTADFNGQQTLESMGSRLRGLRPPLVYKVGITSNIIKVEGEGPATLGCLKGAMWYVDHPFCGYVLLGPTLVLLSQTRVFFRSVVTSDGP